MSLKASLLAAALSLPPPWTPPPSKPAESPAEYRARVAVIAEATAMEARAVVDSIEANGKAAPWPVPELAFAVLTKFYDESRFALDVHSGERGGDYDRKGRARAWCLGQHWRNGRTRAEHRALAGTSLAATRRCARATAELLVKAAGYCNAPATEAGVARAFALYGSGRTCKPFASSKKRARRWSRLVAGFWRKS